MQGRQGRGSRAPSATRAPPAPAALSVRPSCRTATVPCPMGSSTAPPSSMGLHSLAFYAQSYLMSFTSTATNHRPSSRSLIWTQSPPPIDTTTVSTGRQSVDFRFHIILGICGAYSPFARENHLLLCQPILLTE